MIEPDKEQGRGLWRRYGFGEDGDKVVYPDGRELNHYPSLDVGNLIKYTSPGKVLLLRWFLKVLFCNGDVNTLFWMIHDN